MTIPVSSAVLCSHSLKYSRYQIKIQAVGIRPVAVFQIIISINLPFGLCGKIHGDCILLLVTDAASEQLFLVSHVIP